MTDVHILSVTAAHADVPGNLTIVMKCECCSWSKDLGSRLALVDLIPEATAHLVAVSSPEPGCTRR